MATHQTTPTAPHNAITPQTRFSNFLARPISATAHAHNGRNLHAVFVHFAGFTRQTRNINDPAANFSLDDRRPPRPPPAPLSSVQE